MSRPSNPVFLLLLNTYSGVKILKKIHISTCNMRIEMLKTKKEVCELLSLTRDGLTKLQQKDPSFPRPIKFSKERQAHAYFDIKELQEWLELKKSEREDY
mgnify:CR=1 FL=1